MVTKTGTDDKECPARILTKTGALREPKTVLTELGDRIE